MLPTIMFIVSLWSDSLLSGFEANSDHAIYISVVEIVDIPIEQKGNLRVKIFTDDLEDAIRNRTGEKIALTKHCEQNLEVVTDYLNDHLKITLNDSLLHLTPLSCENVDISIWLEYEFDYESEWTTIDIYSDHLMELFPTQSNVFSVKYKEEKRMFRLTNSKKAMSLAF